MSKQTRTPALLALLVAVLLASAYVIVANNGPSGPAGQVPAGVMH